MTTILGRVIFSNYNTVVNDHKPVNELIARKYVPKGIARFGRSILSRRINRIHPHDLNSVRQKSPSKARKAISTEDISRFQTTNQKMINNYTKSENLTNYLDSLRELKLVDMNWVQHVNRQEISQLKQDIFDFSHWIAAHPNYSQMTSDELKNAFSTNWRDESQKNPQKTLDVADLYEATNFALHVFLCKTDQHDSIADLHQQAIKYNDQNLAAGPQNTPINRIANTDDEGNLFLDDNNHLQIDDNQFNKTYYSFDLIPAYQRKDILNAVGATIKK